MSDSPADTRGRNRSTQTDPSRRPSPEPTLAGFRRHRARLAALERCLRWALTALTCLALGLYIATYFVQVRWDEPQSVVLNLGDGTSQSLATSHAIFRGDRWRFMNSTQPANAPTPNFGPYRVEPIGKGVRLPFLPGTVSISKSTSLLSIVLWPLAGSGALWGAVYVRRRSVPKGHCTVCRYDLRSCAHESCPECGTPIDVALLGPPA